MSCVFLALFEGKVETGELVGEGGGWGKERDGDKSSGGGIILGKSEKISGESEGSEGFSDCACDS